MSAEFKQILHLPLVMPVDQMKRSGEKKKKEEDVGFHQGLGDVFRRVCLSSPLFRGTGRQRAGMHGHAHTNSAKRETLLHPHLHLHPPAPAHGRRICHLFVLEKELRSKQRDEGHLLVFLQGQEQLLAFRFNQELQRCRVTLEETRKEEVRNIPLEVSRTGQ